MKNKKGISPLIATVLLIGLTVALVVVVANWSFDFLKKTTKDTEDRTKQSLACANDLSFQITEVDCAQNTLAIDNRGTIDITKIILRVFKGPDIVPLPEEGVQALGKKTYNVDLAGAKKIEAIASIKGGEGKPDIICSQVVETFETQC